jgi:hypothetical protein
LRRCPSILCGSSGFRIADIALIADTPRSRLRGHPAISSGTDAAGAKPRCRELRQRTLHYSGARLQRSCRFSSRYRRWRGERTFPSVGFATPAPKAPPRQDHGQDFGTINEKDRNLSGLGFEWRRTRSLGAMHAAVDARRDFWRVTSVRYRWLRAPDLDLLP